MTEDALQQLLQYRRELFGFIRAIVRSTHDAEDLFQEVAKVIVEKAGQGEEIRDFRAWSKEIARRIVKNHFRQAQARKDRFLPVDEMAELAGDVYGKYSPTGEELSDEYDALHQCMEGIPEHASQMVRMRFLLDYGYDEIAKRLQRSETAIRRAVARSRLALMECVKRRLGVAER
jgi:RNA polymerase sigma-70 factor, ECF subfamily